MTSRKRLQRNVCIANAVFWGGMALFIASLCILKAIQNELSYVLLVLGASLSLGGLHYAHRFGLRCSACRGSLYYYLMKLPNGWPGWWLSESAQVCPYCSHRFDEELPQRAMIAGAALLNEALDTPSVRHVTCKSDSVQHDVTGRELINKHRHCPWCNYGLRSLMHWTGRLPSELKVCPHCATQFDRPVCNRLQGTMDLPHYPE